MTTLGRYQKTLEHWGLRNIPFRTAPPEDVETLARIFYGRKQELELALPTLYEGRNILVRGIWGVGKTAFIRYLLYRLQNESATLELPLLILYLGRFPGEGPEAFYRALLLTLAEEMAAHLPRAQRVKESLRGLQITRSRQARVEGKVDLRLISLGGSWGEEHKEGWHFQNVYPVMLDLLQAAQTRYERVLIAVDDLDKKTPRAFQDILDDATDLLRGGEGKRGFLLTGRFLSTLQDTSDLMLGLFGETITLHRMSTDDLQHVAVNYLNTVRQRPSGQFTPFTSKVLAQIAEYAYHIPRQFNLICERVMRRGAMEGVACIDEQSFPDLWRQVQDSFALELTPDIRHLLYVAQRKGGLSADAAYETLEELGVETFVELLPILKQVEGDLMIRQEDGKWVPSRLLPDNLSPD